MTYSELGRRRFLVTVGSTAIGGSLAGCLGSAQPSPDVTVPVPVQGDFDANVTVAVFKDFACPHCRRYTLNVESKLKTEYVAPGEIRYEYHDFPIPVSDWSYRVANVARAVQDTAGDDAFWTFATNAYERQPDYSWETLASLAAPHGIARDKVQSLATAARYEEIVKADRLNGVSRDVTGTPTVFVNGEVINPWRYSEIAAAIENAK